MYKKTSSEALLVILVGIFLLGLPSEMMAQPRDSAKKSKSPNTVVVKKPKRQVAKVVKLPAGHKTIVVKGTNYYHHKGIFYKRRSSGFVVVRAPIGAEIPILPAGYVTIRIGGVAYYHYYATYYRYDPVKKAYIVIEKPESAEEAAFDRVHLVDGSTLEGVYMSGTQSIIQFEAAGEIMEIPIEEVVSIIFAPGVASD